MILTLEISHRGDRNRSSVRNTCVGCLSPGAGKIADYLARPPATNDPHAFGPVTLAFGVAPRLLLS